MGVKMFDYELIYTGNKIVAARIWVNSNRMGDLENRQINGGRLSNAEFRAVLARLKAIYAKA
jgi:hypothetical protein